LLQNLCCFKKINFKKSAPANATFDTTAYAKEMIRMKTLASDSKFIIPGHDALLFSKFPLVAAGVIKIK